MKVKEIELILKLKIDILLKDLPEQLSKAVNFYFLNNEKSKQFHEKNFLKLYSVSLLEPTSKTGHYYKGDTHTLKIRYFDDDIFNLFLLELFQRKNPIIEVLYVNKKELPFSKDIKCIKTSTAAVITNEDVRNWTANKDDLDYVKQRIISNTNKKYAALYGEDLNSHDFIERIELLNKCSFAYNYKGGKILSNKFRIYIKDDLISKKLGYLLLGTGLLEKNSLTFGFCDEDLRGGEGVDYARTCGVI